MTGSLRRRIACALVLVAPSALAAQAPADTAAVRAALQGSAASFRACAAAIPRTGGHLTVVHLTARPASREDSLPPAVHQSVDLFVETVAVYARGRLGAAPGNLPYADSTQDRGLVSLMFSGHVHVVGRRDGTVRWWAESDSTPSGIATVDSMVRLGERLVGASLDSALRSGEFFQWPERYEGTDSIAFAIHFAHPLPDAAGKLQPIRARHAAPLIAVHMTSVEPVVPLEVARIAYPRRALEYGGTGTVIMSFVVDTAGTPVPGTIRDLWPANRKRLRGDAATIYRDFVRAVSTGIRHSRYRPARVGGCAYPSLVQQPFSFDIER